MDNPDGWSRIIDDYLTNGHNFTFPFAKKAIDTAPIPSTTTLRPIKFLDVACGTGAAVEALQRKFESKEVDILATDFSIGMVNYVKKISGENGWTNVETKVVDATAMDLADNSFDAISCIFGVMLMPNSDKALSEMYRVLSPQGSASIVTWHHQDLWPIMFGAAAKVNSTTTAAPLAVPTGAAFNTATNAVTPTEKPKNWTDLEFNEEKLTKAGFKDVQGTIEKTVIEIKDMLEFFTMMLRNPGMAAMVAAWTPEQIEEFKKLAMELLEQAQGKKDSYTFGIEANVVHGRKL